MTKIICIGGGNHLSYTSDIIEKEGKYEIIGVLDSKKNKGDIVSGYEVLGKPENLREIAEIYPFEGMIITIGDNWSRKKVFDIVSSQTNSRITKNIEFVNAIHPTVCIGKNVKIGIGIIAMAGCIINTGAFIGDFTFFATGAQIEHDCNIKNFASVSAGSVMGGFVTLKECSAVALGVTIIDRVTIGKNSVVGSGSLVTKSVQDNVLVYGIPAKIIRPREPGEQFLK